MKFIVKHSVFDEVDVTLAYETKDKLKKAAWIGFAVIVGACSLSLYNTNKRIEIEEIPES